MELLLVSTRDDSHWTNWDIEEVDGIASVVPEEAEEDQEATVVSYIEKNTIPLLEDKGIDWSGYLTKTISLAEIDTQIRNNIKTYLDDLSFTPLYYAKDGALCMKLAKTIINTGATS